MINKLKKLHNSSNKTKVFHIDLIDVAEKSKQDLIFEITITKGIQDKKGEVWYCQNNTMFLFELNNSAGQEQNLFLTMLPTTECLSPKQSAEQLGKISSNDASQLLKDNQDDSKLRQLFDDEIYRSVPVQKSCQYLERYGKGENLDNFQFSEDRVEGTHLSCLKVLLKHCPVENPSYQDLNFTAFLNWQLQSCENSSFCNLQKILKDAEDVRMKNFVIKFIIDMSKDFATRSVNISDEGKPMNKLTNERKNWEHESHPYIFFNDDRSTMSFFNICLDGQQNLINVKTKEVLIEAIMSVQLFAQLSDQCDKGNTERDLPMFNMFDDLPDSKKLRFLTRVFGVERDDQTNPDPSYKLTSDNVGKMLAIYTRFKCGIPVVIMGETGCGKTRLIKYMCDIGKAEKEVNNLIIVKCHGGTTASGLQQQVKKAMQLAEENEKEGVGLTVLFFDEANTTKAIKTVKEIMLDRLVDGEEIPQNCSLQLIAAVNPYRQHSEAMIHKLENAGLGYHIRVDQTKDKIGAIPLRRLVYRVQALPPSMFPLVWDFGTLSAENEEKYIQEMVISVQKEGLLNQYDTNFAITVLKKSQNFMRQKKDECSFVSLRDVERTISAFKWFSSKQDILTENIKIKLAERLPNKKEFFQNPTVSFMVEFLLSIGLCYYVKLDKARPNYSRLIQDEIKLWSNENINLSPPIDMLREVVFNCQVQFIEEIELDSSIAKNEALMENFWMMAICLELRIPLFVVGKPGSSKSLARTIINDVMQGKDSKSELFQNLKGAHMVSFQCSPLATSDAIISVFRHCQNYQKNKKEQLDEFTAAVILDEVGLAEDSQNLALKALHPLLEDGCLENETPEPWKKVSFIGISNWALDPAKMNRGIFLSRMQPDEESLIKIGQSIGDGLPTMKEVIPKLASWYLSVYKEQNREYFGLRDYYSLIKMICSEVEKHGQCTYDILHYCVIRNFGGNLLNDEQEVNDAAREKDAVIRFLKCKDFHYMKTLELDDPPSIRKIIQDALAQKGRFQLLLTKNDAALKIVQMKGFLDHKELTVLYGSSFPKDQEFAKVCATINKIKLCMETGQTVVLVNLHNMYESLYDLLNQHYSLLRGDNYVDLGLGTVRVKCKVHKDFRIIIVAEKKDVIEKFPIPLINRFIFILAQCNA